MEATGNGPSARDHQQDTEIIQKTQTAVPEWRAQRPNEEPAQQSRQMPRHRPGRPQKKPKGDAQRESKRGERKRNSPGDCDAVRSVPAEWDSQEERETAGKHTKKQQLRTPPHLMKGHCNLLCVD